MREGWREVKLSELVDNHIVELKRGKIIAKTLLSDDKEYPVYSASAQGNGLLGYSDTYDLDEELISWSVDGGGRPFYREKHKFSVTNVCGYLRILDTSVLDYRFLYYCMRSEWQKNKFDYSHKAHPSVIKELYNILIPPLDEQKKIAKVLSDLENLENIHSAKADVLSRMKEHLMDNKSGIIEKERNRSVFDADLIRLQDEIKKNIHIDFDRLNSTNLDAQIKFYKDNVDKIVHTIRVITYIGEDKQYERERERESLTPDIEWRTVKLRDIIKITSGEFIKKDLQNPNGQYKVYNGGTSHTGCYDKFNVEGPKVIISSRGTAGFVNRVFENFWAGNSCYVLNILDETELDFDFLYYILKSNQEKLQGQTQSGTIPAINMGQVYDLDINIPVKISEQKRIAKVLSDLDRLQELHGLKVNKLYKMKEHLMDNKSGIIEKERNRSNIDSRILELSSKLGLKFNDTSLNDINTKIKIHKESLDKINYRIEVITYVGENKQYEREREFNSRYSLGYI